MLHANVDNLAVLPKDNAVGPLAELADATDSKSNALQDNNCLSDKTLSDSLSDDEKRQTSRTLVVCSKCGAQYAVARIRHDRNHRRLCVKCRSQAGQATQIKQHVVPPSSKQQRIAANGLINMRNRRGAFKTPKRCMKCGDQKRLDSHHPDYSKPNEVVWLCRSCHMLAHRRPHYLDGVRVMRTVESKNLEQGTTFILPSGGAI